MKEVRKKVLSLGIVAALTVQTVLPGGMVLHASEKGTAHLESATLNVKTIGMQNGATTLDMQLYARYDSESVSADGGSLEIVEYNSQNGYAYAVNGIKGTLAAVKVDAPADTVEPVQLNGSEYDAKELVEKTVSDNDEFKYGSMTSVAVSPDGTKLAAAVQNEVYDKAGVIVVFTCNSDGSISSPHVYPTGIQPNMVTFADNNTVLSADEGEPRNGYGDGAVDPEGSVTVLNLGSGMSSQVGFGNFTAQELAAENVLIGVVDGKAISPATDLEPEYISVSEDGSKAYVTLQEANAVAVLDVENKTFTGIYSVGFEDYSSVKVDIKDDGGYNPSVYDNLVGARMPDGIAVYEKDGKTYLVTANEGDSREWADYSNEITQTIAGAEVTVLNSAKCIGIPEGKNVLFGGRGFTIFRVTDSGLKEVYDSGADFESITADAFPSNFNCSNNNTMADACSTSKGPEPKSVTIGQIEGRTYAFIALERISGIMAYDITNPEYSMNVNYMNSRDFSSKIAGDVSPEGICTAVIAGKPVVMAAGEVSGTLAVYALTKQDADDIIVLYTNDVHNAYEKSADCLGYASVAQYKNQLESLGYQVELVDNGDAIQGEIIGTLSKGSYLKDIMKQTGYSFAIPGNHEFDFGMDNFLQIAKEAEKDNGYQYLSCNFINLKTNQTVFSPYKIVEKAGKKVAYIGVSTPESFTKSTPAYFQDEDGNYIYGFCEGNDGEDLYVKVQETINDAKSAGADYIVVLSHLGTDPSSEPWTSKDLIAHTTGMDALLDGHSHSTISSEVCKDLNNRNVVLTSTGTKLKNLGVLRIDTDDDSVSSKLVNNISMQDSATLSYVNGITEKFKDLQNSVVAASEITLTTNDPVTGNRLVRSQETNLGDLCADAYRELLGADIAFVNGGGVRANINKGNITYGDIINVHPFGNKACLVEATGQEILDALELGARVVREGENGGFLQVSGLTYDIDTTIPSSVVLDDKKMFVKVNGAYRVKNVKVGGKALDLTKTYTLASHNYMLKKSGDGYSMFADNKILQDEVKVDNQVLIEYITNTLGGKIKADSIYANPYGEKRIRVITESKEPTKDSDGYIKYLQGSSVITEIIKAEGTSGPTTGEVTEQPAADNTPDKEEKHTYKQTIVPATIKKDGKITERCTVCGDTKTTIIPRISKVTLSTTKYTYNGKTRRPAITVTDSTENVLKADTDYTISYKGDRKNVGIYTVKVVFRGNYHGTVIKSFTIIPKGTSISKVSSASKSLNVTWKKQKSQTTGYQIQYSTSSGFAEKKSSTVNVNKNSVVSKTIVKIHSYKKYYVRVRTYKTVKWNGETRKVYSKWSSVKSVTVLK